MIGLCRDKEYINCAILKELDVQPEQEVPQEEPVTDTVFEPEPEPETTEKKPEPKPEKKPKKPGLFTRLTAGLTEVTGNLFDENIEKIHEEDK